MKMNLSRNNSVDRPSRAQGFTLVEVLIALSVLMILLPAVLAASFQLNAQAFTGIKHNDAITEARQAQQLLTQKINQARSFDFRNNGNTLLLEMYNPASSNWQENAITFLPDSNMLIYSEAGNNDSDGKEVAQQVHRSQQNQIFSADEAGVNCQFYIGENPPDDTSHERGPIRNTGCYINMTVSPRNQGRIQ